ncbi:hypothetical protein AXG93_4846s1150 [Marchantia polymorpha subsp. ruderalis]|uniref:Uncharacterized protein n=1 Tax=Marchantia polymorpha subsp. ruderalis TaxID=1480154 RepID=A0A176VCX9_MARPO|nr:hypothetical protein AXG93_4846s1150 [Marchantia polymorpha subsp. ruderalis]
MSGSNSNEVLVKLLRRKYDPDIKDEVSELLKEALRNESSKEPRLSEAGSRSSASPKGCKQRKAVVTATSPHYDIMRDIGAQRPNVTFQQLWENNKAYRKLLTVAMRKPCRLRPTKLLEIYHVENEDLGPSEIEVEICGCIIIKVPIDSGSGVNIMTEETARNLGFHQFEPTPKVLRATLVIYCTNLFGLEKEASPNRPDRALITVPWKKVPHEGETPSTSSGYTSAEDTSSTDEEDWEVSYMECYEIEEEGLVDTAEDD